MGRKDADFESGIRQPCKRSWQVPLSCSGWNSGRPGFTSGQNYRIHDLELASRLSYFLWSTAPDDALITVAGAGKLHDPVELEKQVRRMLADPRSESLSTRFALSGCAWRSRQRGSGWSVVSKLRPYPSPSRCEKRRSYCSTDIVREDRNLLDLLTADYTFVNERLALHYKIPGILGSRFRRVTLTMIIEEDCWARAAF